jgi:anti-sigma28 factor (negative regulator of flagellin synthesis)
MEERKKKKENLKDNIHKVKKIMEEKENMDKKVEILKELIRKGKYNVSPEEVAKKMLEFFSKNKKS